MNQIALIIVSGYLLFTILLSFYKKDFFNPLVFFFVPLSISYYLYYIVFRPIVMVSNQTLLAFIIGITGFIFGFIVSLLISAAISKRDKGLIVNKKQLEICLPVVYLSALIGVIGFVVTLNYFRQLGGGLGFDSAAFDVRETYIENARDLPFLVTYGKYFLLFSTAVLFSDFLDRKKKYNKYFIFILIFLCILNSFMTMSRTDLMISIIPLFIIYYRNYKKSRINVVASHFVNRIKMLIIISLSISAILVIGTLRTTSNGGMKSILDPNNYLTQYVGYPIVAFDKWIVNQPGVANGLQSFEPIYKIVDRLNLFSEKQIIVAPRGQFNVYSFLKSPYLDYGIYGLFIILIVFGLFCGWLYTKSQKREGFFTVFYAFYMYGVFMSFFTWSFTNITFVYLLFFIGLVKIGVKKTTAFTDLKLPSNEMR